MAAIQLTGLTVAEAEHVVSWIWRILERDDLASPRVAAKEVGGAVELLIVFGTQDDVDAVMRKLADSSIGVVFDLVESGDAAVESTALALPGNLLDEPLVYAENAASASDRVQEVVAPFTFKTRGPIGAGAQETAPIASGRAVQPRRGSRSQTVEASAEDRTPGI